MAAKKSWFQWLSLVLKLLLCLLFGFIAWQMIGVRQAFDKAGEHAEAAAASSPAASR
jgi:hypothetical protein